MLKVNVGLSRKVSQDYNSAGFSVNFEGEICAPLDDPQQVIQRVKELYDLAEETLNVQMDHYQMQRGQGALTSSAITDTSGSSSVRSTHQQANRPTTDKQSSQSNGNAPEFVPATNKQISFLLNIGKRQGLNKPQLENRVAALIGRHVDLYQLSKREAGLALDQFAVPNNFTMTKQSS